MPIVTELSTLDVTENAASQVPIAVDLPQDDNDAISDDIFMIDEIDVTPADQLMTMRC